MQFKTTAGKLVLLAVLGGVIVPALAIAGPTKDQAAAAIQAADAARKKAASVDGEWRDTGKMIKEAQAALEAGELAEAVRLADQAKAQGELGYEQATSQINVNMRSYLNY